MKLETYRNIDVRKSEKAPNLICDRTPRCRSLTKRHGRDSTIGRHNKYSSRSLLRKCQNFCCNVLHRRKGSIFKSVLQMIAQMAEHVTKTQMGRLKETSKIF